MSQDQEPRRNHISCLPLIAIAISGLLELAQAHHSTMLQAHGYSHVLDDYTVDCLVEVFTEQSNVLQRYEEQLAEWKETELTPFECQQMENLGRQLAKLREMMTATLAVAKDMKGGAAESL